METNEIIKKLYSKLLIREPIIIAGVGSGLTAKGAVNGGADILAVYSTAVYRIHGLPTALAFLPYDDANTLTFITAPEIIANSRSVPVLLGLGAHDPRKPISKLLDQVQALGAAGVTNEPFIGIYSKDLRMQLEEAGLGFSREVELIKGAVNCGMLALGWAFNPEEALQMAEVGCQMIGAMIGVTSGGALGGSLITPLDEAIEKVVEIEKAVHKIKKDTIILCHGGPFNDPQSVSKMFEYANISGYVTGSTGERVPVEKSVAKTISEYKKLQLSNLA
jgi:predicted TIM-barrel enzyme